MRMNKAWTLLLVVCAAMGCGDDLRGMAMAGLAVAPGPTATVMPRGAGELAVSWTAIDGATSYSVWQSADGGDQALAASVFDSQGGPPPTSFIATGMVAGSRYCFAVTAVLRDGNETAQGVAACMVMGDVGGMVRTKVIATSPTGPHPWVTIDLTNGSATTNLNEYFTVGDRLREVRVRVVDNTQPGSCVGCSGPTRLVSNLRRYSPSTGGNAFPIASSAPSSGSGAFQVLTIPALDIPVSANGDMLSLQTIDFSGVAPTTVWSVEVDYQPGR